jgi:D-alanine-D-alanine ligase
MARIKVGVLRGGPSSEYDVSLQTGGTVLSNLGEQYEPLDFFIDKSGQWHHRGRPTEPAKALNQVDVVFNALHGEYGEDGEVQRLLDSYGVPYTGSKPLASALAMNKVRSKEIAESLGFKTSRHMLVDLNRDTEEQAKEMYYTLFQPLVVKPVALGSSVGVVFAQGLQPLIDAIDSLRPLGQSIMVEEYKNGVEATVGVVDQFRGRPRYTLLPVEIRPARKSPIFDYTCKYDGTSEEICPGNFSNEQSAELQRMATEIHDALNLRHYSRSDFIVTPKRIYYLETNTLPGLTQSSLMPKSLAAVGATLPEFLNHVLDLALHST